jgi:hypothetical protein
LQSCNFRAISQAHKDRERDKNMKNPFEHPSPAIRRTAKIGALFAAVGAVTWMGIDIWNGEKPGSAPTPSSVSTDGPIDALRKALD